MFTSIYVGWLSLLLLLLFPRPNLLSDFALVDCVPMGINNSPMAV